MLEAIRKRRSVRKYQARDIEPEKLNEILRAAMFSPSGHHCRSWEFVVVKNQKTKESLSLATPYSSFTKDASIIIALCANDHLDPLWIENLSIAAAYIYLETTNQGLGTCFIQIRGAKTTDGQDSEQYVRKIIKAPNNIRILCLLPLGYPNEQKEEHQEKEFEKSKIHEECW